jgi:acetate kinase
MQVLVLNPGSNSLKFEVVETSAGPWGRKKLIGIVEPVGPE